MGQARLIQRYTLVLDMIAECECDMKTCDLGEFCKFAEARAVIERLEKQIDELKDENQRLMRELDGTKEELRLQGERDQQEFEADWDK